MNLIKNRLHLFLFVTLFFSGVLLAEERKFVNAKGQSIRAELVEVNDGDAVLALTKNGKKYTVATDSLSDKDQAYIAEWKAHYEATKHPLDWKLVRFHCAVGEELILRCEALQVDSSLAIKGVEELYLPVGAYIDFTHLTKVVSGGVRFDGEILDYYVTVEGGGTYISTKVDERGERISGEVVQDLRSLSVVQSIEVKRVIKFGGGVYYGKALDENKKYDWRSLKASNVYLYFVGKRKLDWSMLGSEVKRLVIMPSGLPRLDLTGIDQLSGITHLSVVFVTPPIGLEAIAKLKNLRSLNLSGRFTPQDLEKLAGIKGLKHFVLCNGIEGHGNRDEYDFIGGYTELQSLVMSNGKAHSKPINEMILKGLTDLTILEIDENSFNNGRKSLENLKNLKWSVDEPVSDDSKRSQ